MAASAVIVAPVHSDDDNSPRASSSAPTSGDSTVTVREPIDTSAWYVLVLEGTSARTLRLPAGGPVDVGRDDACFVVLRSEGVSRRHARLQVSEAGVEVEDLKSKNGSRLDGEALSARVPMRPGALLELGGSTLLVQRGAPPPSRPLETPEAETSDAMQKVLRAVRCVATDDITVLLLGETGVGKEVTAERIHAGSDRKSGPFVRVHCAAITEALFESELFGHEKGSFTGATGTRVGLLESAHGGTVFIDEVGELPPHVQVKLLRVLEDRRVRRVGGGTEKTVDVRFIAATNRELEAEVAAGRFRQDLYFRLSAFTICIPALRHRIEEIDGLARTLLSEICAEKGLAEPRIEPALMDALKQYGWPGNVRELKHILRRVLIVGDGETLKAADLPTEEMARRAGLMLGEAATSAPDPLESDDEETRILAALEQCGGNQTEAAALLGISRRTLINRLDKYGLARPRKK